MALPTAQVDAMIALVTVADAEQSELTRADDAELVARAALGDRAALGEIYDRHAPKAHALALGLLRNPREAEDVVQDVFLELWRDAPSYDVARGSPLAWILVKTRSRTLDRLRRTSLRRAGDLASPEAQRAIRRIAESPERAMAVREAVAALPDDVRDVIFHVFFLGSTGPEAAKALDVPEGTVRSRLARGLSSLERALQRRGKP